MRVNSRWRENKEWTRRGSSLLFVGTLELLLQLHAESRPLFLGQHEGVQIAHLREARLDVLHVHLHRVLELWCVLGPQSGLDLGKRVLKGLQLEGISVTETKFVV